MNKLFSKISLSIVAVLSIVSCSKSSSSSTEPLRDYDVQYAADLITIDEYLDSHYITVDGDYNVTFDTIIDNNHPSIRLQTDYPLQFRMYENTIHNVDYKIYYLSLREGTKDRPCTVDSVHVSYKGSLMNRKSTQFDSSQNPIWFTLDNVVSGWSKIFPFFKTGEYTSTEGPNPVNFTDYGAGVMFLPSGLGYFGSSSPSGSIPAYSPLTFTFKLLALRYRDNDRDGILSKDEVPIGSLPTYDPLDYDSDGDGFANMNDVDDDGDHVLTRIEIKDPDGVKYMFNLIPDCSGNNTNPTRLKKHLDPSCH